MEFEKVEFAIPIIKGFEFIAIGRPTNTFKGMYFLPMELFLWPNKKPEKELKEYLIEGDTLENPDNDNRVCYVYKAKL